MLYPFHPIPYLVAVSYLFDGYEAFVGQDLGALGDADLAHEALVRVVVLVDFEAVELGSEVGVDVAAGVEHVEQIGLACHPGEHPGLDVGGVRDVDQLAGGGDQRFTQLGAAVEVLKVESFGVVDELAVGDETMAWAAVEDVIGWNAHREPCRVFLDPSSLRG